MCVEKDYQEPYVEEPQYLAYWMSGFLVDRQKLLEIFCAGRRTESVAI